MQTPLDSFLATHPQAQRICDLQQKSTTLMASHPLPLPPSVCRELDRIQMEMERVVHEMHPPELPRECCRCDHQAGYNRVGTTSMGQLCGYGPRACHRDSYRDAPRVAYKTDCSKFKNKNTKKTKGGSL